MAARKKSDAVKYLDVSGPVSEADYERVMKSLLAQFDTWRASNNWCSEFYIYVGQLTTTFRWNRDNRQMEMLVPVGFSDEDRGRDLREVRGRILRFTVESRESLSLDKANEFLTTAGLAPYQAESQPVLVDIGAYAYRVPSDQTSAQIREKFIEAITSAFGAEIASRWEINISPRQTRPQVPNGETVRLLARSSL